MSFIFIFVGFVFILTSAVVMKKTVRSDVSCRTRDASSILILIICMIYQRRLDGLLNFDVLNQHAYSWFFLRNSFFIFLMSFLIRFFIERKQVKVKKTTYLIIGLFLAVGAIFLQINFYEQYQKTLITFILFKSYFVASCFCCTTIGFILCLVTEKRNNSF